MFDVDLGVEGVVLQIVDDDRDDGAAEFVDDLGEQIMGLGAGDGDVLQVKGDGVRDIGANPDRLVAIRILLFEDDDPPVVA